MAQNGRLNIALNQFRHRHIRAELRKLRREKKIKEKMGKRMGKKN